MAEETVKKDPASKNTQELATTASSSHCRYSRHTPNIAHNILFHHKNARCLYSTPILGTDCSICLPTLGSGIGYSKHLILSSEEKECAPGGLYTVLVAKCPVVVGLTPLAILLQFQVLHSTLIHSVVASLPWLIDLTVNLSIVILSSLNTTMANSLYSSTFLSYWFWWKWSQVHPVVQSHGPCAPRGWGHTLCSQLLTYQSKNCCYYHCYHQKDLLHQVAPLHQQHFGKTVAAAAASSFHQQQQPPRATKHGQPWWIVKEWWVVQCDSQWKSLPAE